MKVFTQYLGPKYTEKVPWGDMESHPDGAEEPRIPGSVAVVVEAQ